MGASFGPGSQASPEAAGASSPDGFDPSRVIRMTKVIRPTITVEDGIREGECPDGRREIWARHVDAPQLDALLVTVHYNYAYHDNSTIGGVAERIARLLAGSESDRSPEGSETRSGSTEGESAVPEGHSPNPKSLNHPVHTNPVAEEGQHSHGT